MLALAALPGCSSIATEQAASGIAHDEDDTYVSSGDDGVSRGHDDHEPDSGGDETGGAGDDGDGSAELPPNAAPCPDPLPDGWIFCEDFEQLENPSDVFFEFQDNEGRLLVVDDEGASGSRSLRATYETGKQSAGWVSIVFGRNPIVYGARPHFAPDRDFDEIYWRLRVKMQAGWPDVGPHRLTRLTAFAHADWAQALIANLSSNGSDVTLLGEPASCVLDGLVPCSGFNDLDGLRLLSPLLGETPIFSKGMSGEWHCVEGHVKLNTPGVSDGVFEFWVDDHLEDGAYDVNWRGTWADYGLNLVSIENFWTGGAPGDLSRWVDDIVIATEPVGCD